MAISFSKILTISTSHIPLQTAVALGMTEEDVLKSALNKVLAMTPWADYGWIISVGADARDGIAVEHRELAKLFDFAIDHGVDYLMIDRDAEKFPDLFPQFDWENDQPLADNTKNLIQGR